MEFPLLRLITLLVSFAFVLSFNSFAAGQLFPIEQSIESEHTQLKKLLDDSLAQLQRGDPFNVVLINFSQKVSVFSCEELKKLKVLIEKNIEQKQDLKEVSFAEIVARPVSPDEFEDLGPILTQELVLEPPFQILENFLEYTEVELTKKEKPRNRAYTEADTYRLQKQSRNKAKGSLIRSTSLPVEIGK